MNPKEKVVIYLYNRLFDPLIQSNFWLYIKDYLEHDTSRISFHLITYEDKRFPLTAEQARLVKQWRDQGLEWTELKWHPGMGLTPKFIDLFSGLIVFSRLRAKGYSRIVSLGSVAGTFAYLYAMLLHMRLFLYQFEPHSEFSRDSGAWSSTSIQFRLSQFLERRSAYYATVITSGTKFMEDRLKNDWRVKGRFIKIPSVANSQKFEFNSDSRSQVRDELGISESEKVLFYAGKFHGLYYGVETAWLFRWLSDISADLRMLIVTPHDDASVHEL